MPPLRRHKVAMILFYFGAVPPFFDLWRRSAEANEDFDFLIYTDMALPVPAGSNVRVMPTTWDAWRERVRERLGERRLVLNAPYKMTDYRTALGKVVEEDIAGYDFFGVGDMDVIYGDLSDFITDDLLDSYDRLFYHGHFQLYRNTEKMRSLYRAEYPHILTFRYVKSTRYICHSDESGACAWASEYDPTVRMYFDWLFYDPPFRYYKFREGKTEDEAYCLWRGGKLTLHHAGGGERELLYIHLQHRKMTDEHHSDRAFAILRTVFADVDRVPEILASHDPAEDGWTESKNKAIARGHWKKLGKGNVRFLLYRKLHRIRSK